VEAWLDCSVDKPAIWHIPRAVLITGKHMHAVGLFKLVPEDIVVFKLSFIDILLKL